MSRRLTTDNIFAGIVFIVGLVTYLSSVAPTTSFWDCGEFIACSYTMGVPHPPGSPLFLLLGRVMTLLPTAHDIGFRINLLSVLFSSFSLLFLYLSIVRLIRMCRGPDQSREDSFLVGAGAFIGTLTLAFSYSFWFNAVEAEVYAGATFFTAITLWLILKWQDHADAPKGDKILLLIAYIIGLATGIHLLNLLALWTLFMIVYFHKFKFTWEGFFLQLLIASAAFLVIYPGVVKYIPSSMESISVWTPIVLIIALIIALILAHQAKQRIVALSLAALMLIILGYSTYGVIFIRSNLNPTIDENDPDNLPRLVYYLNREQYGDAPIINRRWNGNPEYSGKWDFFWRYQVHHMYTRYLLWQFVGMKGDYQGAGVDFSKFLALPLLLGFIGMALHFQRDGKRAFSVLTLFFMAGYGIILYLNQEDPQPRERDYSYAGSFYAFAIWIGIGAAYLLELTRNFLRNKSPNLTKIGLYTSSVIILAVVPGNMLLNNYDLCKRSGNYVAWDYSYNILQTCKPNSVLFTNGDNDTFPLWYLQEVEGVRKDVRVVNLSLLNTGWYIKQLRDQEPKVPISFNDNFIEKYIDSHDVSALRRRYWPEGKKLISIETPAGEYMWEMLATMHLMVSNEDRGSNNFIRVQDWMILNIVDTNKGQKPIYFAVTVSNSNMIGLRKYMLMEGLAFRLTPNAKGGMVDPERLRVNLFENFEDHFRNLNNPKVHYNDNIIKLLQNYRSAFLQLAFYHYQKRDAGENPDSLSLQEQYTMWDSLSSNAKVYLTLQKMEEKMPEEVIPLSNEEINTQIARMYYDIGHPEEMASRLDKLAQNTDNWQKKITYAAMYHQWLNKTDEAAQLMKETLKEVKDDQLATVEIAALLGKMGKTEDADSILNDILSENPSDDIKVEIASAYFQMRMDSTAIGIYNEILAFNNANGGAVGGLLSVYERMGDYPSALETVDKWLKYNPSDSLALQKREFYLKMINAG